MAMREPNVKDMPKRVYGFISDFLDLKRLNSENTANDYENDIRQFFWEVKHRHIEMLTENDLILTNQDVEKYAIKLSTNTDERWNNGNPYASSSVARKISSVKKLYNKLEANDYNVKEAWFNIDKIKGETESYGVLEWDEVMKMMELVKSEEKGDVKSTLMEVAVITCFRQNSLLNLTWNNVSKMDGVWVLMATGEAIGKGKKVSIKPITDEIYEQLIAIKEKYGSEQLFPIQKKTVVLMMQRLREKMGLDDNITFHSLKKCGINEAYEISGGDIMAVAEQGDHQSFGTTLRHYMKKKKKYSDMIGLKIGKEVDLQPLEELSHEQLLDLIKKSSRSVQLSLLNQMNK